MEDVGESFFLWPFHGLNSVKTGNGAVARDSTVRLAA